MAFNSCPPTRNIIGGVMFTFQCQAAIFLLRCTAVDKGIYYIAARALLAPSANVHDDDTSLQLPAAACFVYTGPSVTFAFANLRLSTFRFFRSIQCNISIDEGHVRDNFPFVLYMQPPSTAAKVLHWSRLLSTFALTKPVRKWPIKYSSFACSGVLNSVHISTSVRLGWFRGPRQH